MSGGKNDLLLYNLGRDLFLKTIERIEAEGLIKVSQEGVDITLTVERKIEGLTTEKELVYMRNGHLWATAFPQKIIIRNREIKYWFHVEIGEYFRDYERGAAIPSVHLSGQEGLSKEESGDFWRIREALGFEKPFRPTERQQN